jgi:ankyrin repeat protein
MRSWNRLNPLFLVLAFVLVTHVSGSLAEDWDAGLIGAVREGNFERVARFLGRGIDINARNEYGLTVLILASAAGQGDIVQLLLDRGGRGGCAWLALLLYPQNFSNSVNGTALIRKQRPALTL